MKILRQFGLILAITFAGEVLKALLPLPIPASIYGMVIMLVGLVSGLLRLEDVQDVGDFLIEIMPILFVPAGSGTDGQLGNDESTAASVGRYAGRCHGIGHCCDRQSNTGFDSSKEGKA